MSFAHYNSGPFKSELGEFPLPYQPILYAELAKNVYYPNNEHLPPGFYLFENCPEASRWWGYFGKSYFAIDEDTKTLNFIIAHRGTDNFFGMIEDLELWLEEIIPVQYRECARPFMEQTIKNFQAYAAEVYPGYNISYQVTGHSLGASLAQKTVADASLVDYDFNGIIFEAPGLPESQMDKNTRALNDIEERLVLINTRVDAVNSAYPVPSNYQFHIDIDNQVYPLICDLPLPFIPNLIYYSLPYTFEVAHPIAGIVNALGNDYPLKPITFWPHGFLAGFEEYKNLRENASYWDGYINYLWTNNGLESSILHYLFNGNFDYFQNLYKDYFLNGTGQSFLPIEVQNFVTLLFNRLNDVDSVWQSLPQEYKNKFPSMKDFSKWLTYWQLNIQGQLNPSTSHPLIRATLEHTAQSIKTILQNKSNAKRL